MMFETLLLEYDLTNKLRYIVTDNAANMCKAFTTQFPSEECDQEPVATDDDELWEDQDEVLERCSQPRQ